MEFSGTTQLVTAIVLLGSLAAVFICRKRSWSRVLAIAVTVVCLQSTFILAPPRPSALLLPTAGFGIKPGDKIDWDELTANILGRILVSILTVSGVQGRWLWQKPSSDTPGGGKHPFYE